MQRKTAPPEKQTLINRLWALYGDKKKTKSGQGSSSESDGRSTTHLVFYDKMDKKIVSTLILLLLTN